jgi:ABC-type multidrug transport system ATPase subunit
MSNVHDATPAIELHHVSRLYGRFAALQDLSMRVRPGATVLLLGENGAGKSTLLRLIAGLITPSSGTVTIFGSEPRAQRDRIALMSHAPMLYDDLTGLENLRYFASLYSSQDARPFNPAQALRDVGLDPELPLRVGTYSQGMRQRASLARVLMLEPDLLLLDEPFSNLDVASVQRMLERLAGFLAASGRGGVPRTLVLTTHQADLARPLATATVTLSRGRLSAELEARGAQVPNQPSGTSS